MSTDRPSSSMRLGEILVQRGAISAQQLATLLDEHARTHRPVGYLAQELFKVPAAMVEDAWAEQYAHLTETIDPRRARPDPDVLGLIGRRQAWQFGILPVAIEDGEHVLCTTHTHLGRALRFAYRELGPQCRFVLADATMLGEALSTHYPMPGGDEMLRQHADNHRQRLGALGAVGR